MTYVLISLIIQVILTETVYKITKIMKKKTIQIIKEESILNISIHSAHSIHLFIEKSIIFLLNENMILKED